MTNEDMLRVARARVALLEGRVQQDVYDAYVGLVYKPGVLMELSVEEFAAWWGEGDRWERHGREDGSVQMRRIDTSLPFQARNIKEHRVMYSPARPVVSPSGVTYATTTEAAAAISVDARSIAALAKAGRLGWKYAE